MNTLTLALQQRGQSIWLDNITRSLLHNGTLARYISDLSVTGLTSNPSIQSLYAGGLSDEALFFELALQDLKEAAELFVPIHKASHGRDGWVSLEVSPMLARNAGQTVQAARRLHARAGKRNLFIKVPGTPQGLEAIEKLTFDGVPVNVTLLFSSAQVQCAAEAYMRGLERRLAAGLNVQVASVLSLFVSRWDVAVQHDVPLVLHNRLGVAVATLSYQAHSTLQAAPRLAAARCCRSASAAPAMGQHRYQRRLGTRHLVRASLERTKHNHHAA
jgi:transaldolase